MYLCVGSICIVHEPACAGSLKSVYACVEDRGTLAVFLYCLLSYFFSEVFSLNLELAS